MDVFIILSLISLPILYLLKLLFQQRESCCYLLKYECYKATANRQLDTDTSIRIAFRNKRLGWEEFRFLLRSIVRSGIGEQTYGPEIIISGKEQNPGLLNSLEEMDDTFFQTVSRLFDRSGILPQEIDILVVNVSLFSPVPSLTSRIINHYKMRPDVKVYNLSGMGCSASLIAIDLIKNIFKIKKRSLAIVVSSECMGANWYCGKEKSMLLTNCLFRCGGCSMLLTNNPELKYRAIMKLGHLARTHLGSSDDAYECCIQEEDNEGYKGFRLTKKLTKASAQALNINLKGFLPKVLPAREIIRHVYMALKWHKGKSQHTEAHFKSLNVKSALEHFCIHPGGR